VTDRADDLVSSARDLADRFHHRWLEENPFTATSFGIPGYDERVPDESEQGQQAWRAQIGEFLREADTIAAGPLTPADAVTLDCTREAATQELASIDSAAAEYTVTAMQYAGPATFMAVAARTVLPDPAAAENYLARLRASGGWLDQITERLKTGAAKGRLPVAPLAEGAITWAENVLAEAAPGPALSPQPPAGWDRADAWEAEREAVAAEVLRPALARWVATVRELLPQARPSAEAGLAHLPGGAEDYARAVRIFTTLPLSPEELHQTGLDHVALLEARAVELGARIGLSGRDEVLAAIRGSAGQVSPAEAIQQATVAVAGRGPGLGDLPRAAAAAVRGNADAEGHRGERRRAALHAAAAGRRAARDVLVQHRTAYGGDRLGPRMRGLSRSGAGAPPAAVPAAAAH
jgi:uncharacterized protein (DUF885 family)